MEFNFTELWCNLLRQAMVAPQNLCMCDHDLKVLAHCMRPISINSHPPCWASAVIQLWLLLLCYFLVGHSCSGSRKCCSFIGCLGTIWIFKFFKPSCCTSVQPQSEVNTHQRQCWNCNVQLTVNIKVHKHPTVSRSAPQCHQNDIIGKIGIHSRIFKEQGRGSWRLFK